jgi:diguanylate cyclase (GGDEF)-like protein
MSISGSRSSSGQTGGTAPASPRAPEVRVLLVEDDPLDSKRIREMLEASAEARFVVDQALEVEGALGMLQNGRYQVVLLDLTLPEGDGLDVLARAQVAASSVPIIAMGPDQDDALAVEAARLGAQDCLPKGRVEPRRLVRALRQAVERHRLLAEVQFSRHREHYVATHDTLTGLPNRIHVQENLLRMLAYSERSAKPLAVLLVDLDRFKTVNDAVGHSAGDELLRQVAERLCPLIRRGDIMARIGGDEFLIVLQGVDRDHAPAKVAEKVLERLSRPFVLASGEHWVSGSVGIALHPRDGAGVDALVRSADTAMHHAKRSGGDAYRFFDESMNAAVTRRLALEHGLRRALVSGDLVLHYQPRVDLRTGRIVSAEALLRWSSSELGIVTPSEIIPVAEETGLIHGIGRWAVATACAQAKAWDALGAGGLGVAVNVSAHELQGDALLHAVKGALWDSGLDPRRLEIELTETALMRDERAASRVLQELKRIGVRVSLDDFGTGFSSLSLLKTTPVDTLKIDRSFVRDVRTDADDAAIVGAILAMAEKLALGVVAEGVETEQQRDFLRSRGCHEMQGFLFAQPLPADAFVELMKRRKG